MFRSSKIQTGLWPRQGANKEEILSMIKERMGNTVDWGTTPVCGFPSMAPDEVGLEVFGLVQAYHPNAILCHTLSEGEKGFSGVQDLEREVVYMTAELLGVQDPVKDIDGYIAPGGTECNIEGIWIGRDVLLKKIPDPADRRIAILASPAIHYSVEKACIITDVGVGKWQECEVTDPLKEKNLMKKYVPLENGRGMHLVKSNDIGQIDTNQLDIKIRQLFNDKGIRRFIIVLNEGTTLTGAMDNTQEVGQLVSRLREEWSGQAEFYIHVDAAYGAFIYPFLDPEGIWGFRVPEVDSLTADPYKMGKCPMAEGIFLCRKGLMNDIIRETGYVNSQKDTTLCGSRSGAYAAACWATFHNVRFDGFQAIHRDSAGRAQTLFAQIQDQIPKIVALSQELNMVTLVLPSDLGKETLDNIKTKIIDPYCLMWDWFTPDPEGLSSLPRKLVKFNITPDVKNEWLDEIIQLFKEILV
ncbi:pyridoxal-dependent decarboxylase [Patescibacteria group bacterium]